MAPIPITPELFAEWRSPRLGSKNPERMGNPVWRHLIQAKLEAYAANREFSGPSPFQAGPGWCFVRFGRTTTRLPDGRIIQIGGEHEDYYDPDFFIYNDVVVRKPGGKVEIFGYPKEVFPPTDFHTATWLGKHILIIGSLGYAKERQPGTTPVHALQLSGYAMASIRTTGEAPGWIHRHRARLARDGQSIRVTKGEVVTGVDDPRTENIDDWRLWLKGWRWERLTDRRWARWELSRSDGKRNHLWEIGQLAWARSLGESSAWRRQYLADAEREVEKQLGSLPDLEVFRTLHVPPVEHHPCPEKKNELQVTRIRVANTIVRYVQQSESVQLTVEGQLPLVTRETLVRDLLEKLRRLEGVDWVSRAF